MKLLNGLNTDVAAVDQPGGTYRRARNMILDDLAGALATEQAPLLLASDYLGDERFENMEVCGRFNVPGDRIIFGIKARDVVTNDYHDTATLEQIVEVQADGTVTTLEWDGFGKFQFDSANPFQGVGYVNASGELILVWSNGVHKPLYLNADTYRSNQDEPLLVFPEAQFPMVRPVKRGNQDESGNILTGAYNFFIAYETVDGTNNLTQYGPSMGQFQVGMGTTSEELRVRTSVKLKFYGLDTQYNFARIYAVREYDGVEYVYYADRISTQDGDVEWSYKGQTMADATDVTLDELTIPSITYQTAGTLTVSDDRLFMANLTANTITFEEGQTIANNIDVHWTVDEAGLYAAQYDNIQLLGTAGTDRTDDYTSADYRELYPNRGATQNFLGDPAEGTVSDSDHQGLLGGFMPGEVYALYISFLMKDGSWSQAFHIPAGGDSGDFTSTARSGAASLSASTANIRTSGTFDQLLGGKTGYTENTSEDYGFSPFNDVGLNGDAVRHHLMPSPLQMWQATRTAEGGDDSLTASDFANEWCNQQCGLFFQNVVIPSDVSDKVQGFQVFYAKATSDENRVKAYVPTYRWKYDYTNDQQMRIYDPFLLSEKTAIDGWSMLEVYKGMSYKEQLGHTMASTTIDDYAYLPANVITDVFNNEDREGCLAIKLNESLTLANDWHAGYPAYVGGINLLMTTNSDEYNQYGWNSQIVHDTETFDYPERTATEGAIGDNFVSVFGTFLNNNLATSAFSYDNRPDKSSANYGMVYDNQTAGTYYNAVTGASGGSGNLPTGTYLGWGGRMGSFSLLYRNYDNYFLNYAAQTLVPTHDLVRVDGGSTYQSNQTVRGGDVWIAPVVVEFLSNGHGTTGDPQPERVNDNTDFDSIYKQSYFTWSRVHPSKNDIREGTQNWTELVGYANATSTPYYGEDMNQYSLGSHWFMQNDNKSAFPTNGNSLEATAFPNRIIRSNKQGYESTEFQWGTFAPADYYDNALAKDAIVNIEDYQGELIIHHGNAIYKTRSKFNFDASGTNVFVGSGDIFQSAPMELVPDDSGYAGLTHFQDTLMCRAGYIWVDRAGGRIFMLGRQLQELSAKGLRNYIRDEFTVLPTTGMQSYSNTVPVINNTGQGGFALGYDPQNERLLFTKRYAVGSEVDRSGIEIQVDGVTLSYSLRHQCFTSMHDYTPYLYAHSYNKLFAYNEAGNAGITTNDGSENQGGIFEINGAAPGTRYLDDRTEDTTKDSCYVDAVFAMGGPIAKVWQNFNWLTRAGNAEGDGVKNETFERARIYNDEAVSQYSTDFRLTDNRWQFNEFRNWKADAHTGSIFQADGVTFDDDSVLIDNTKAWYNVQRFISDYAIIRLETLNTTGNRLYLLDVAATARKAYR